MKIIVDLDWTGFPEIGNYQSLLDMLSDIHFIDVPDSKIKPLITCGQCSKWKTSDCLRITLDEYGFKKRQSKDTLETWTDPDDYCKDGEAK